MKISYFYDYRKTLPVVEVNNADADNVAYTSFEAENKGSWTYNGSPIAPPSGTWIPTGKKYYGLTTGNISRTGLSTATSYYLSYSASPGANVQVTGGNQSTPTTITLSSGWTLSTRIVSNSSSLTISGTGYIDELRLFPTATQLTTYTHDPLVGVTSMTDSNNKTTYYEYDGLRLKAIKDHNGFLIKSFTYNLRK